MRNVAVFFGGKSCENEISVLTGVFAANLLPREKYAVLPVYIHTDGGMYTSPKMTDVAVFREKRYASFTRIIFDGGSVYALNAKNRRVKRLGKVDVALNCCHGGLGEGGGVSALAEWNGIPLASPPLTASGVFMDKYLTKLVAQALKIPTLEYLRANERDYAKRGAFLLKSVESRLKYPVVVKPSHLGSSIGVTLAKNEEETKRALEAAFRLDDCVLLEKYLQAKTDVNCAAYSIGGEIIVSEAECAFGEGIYTFDEKYVKRTTDAPQGGLNEKGKGRDALNGELREKVRSYTRTLYKRMDLRGVVRMDYLCSEGKVYLCEVNTVPGSLAYYLFCERLTDARAFVCELLEEALREGKREKKLLTTGILSRVSCGKK